MGGRRLQTRGGLLASFRCLFLRQHRSRVTQTCCALIHSKVSLPVFPASSNQLTAGGNQSDFAAVSFSQSRCCRQILNLLSAAVRCGSVPLRSSLLWFSGCLTLIPILCWRFWIQHHYGGGDRTQISGGRRRCAHLAACSGGPTDQPDLLLSRPQVQINRDPSQTQYPPLSGRDSATAAGFTRKDQEAKPALLRTPVLPPQTTPDHHPEVSGCLRVISCAHLKSVRLILRNQQPAVTSTPGRPRAPRPSPTISKHFFTAKL